MRYGMSKAHEAEAMNGASYLRYLKKQTIASTKVRPNAAPMMIAMAMPAKIGQGQSDDQK